MTDRDRLIELLEKYPCMSTAEDCFMESISSDLADYLLANGVIVPKYNVGDTVWYITGIHRTIVKSAIVEEIIINGYGVSNLYVKNDMGGYFEYSVEIFYKTKEEAEAELRKRGAE